MEHWDLSKSGLISREEYKNLEQHLKRIGMITGTESRSGSPDMEDKFGMYDHNADGVLDKPELGKYLISHDKDLAVSINKLRYKFG